MADRFRFIKFLRGELIVQFSGANYTVDAKSHDGAQRDRPLISRFQHRSSSLFMHSRESTDDLRQFTRGPFDRTSCHEFLDIAMSVNSTRRCRHISARNRNVEGIDKLALSRPAIYTPLLRLPSPFCAFSLASAYASQARHSAGLPLEMVNCAFAPPREL